LISELAIVGFHSALAKKIRTKTISIKAADVASNRFKMDCTERFIVLILDSTVLVKAKELIDLHGKSFFCKP
jgi:hypothetical protein